MTLTVLVADDEPDMRFLLQARLQREGWTVVQASSGLEAVERCRQIPVDVLVLDQRMPEMSGVEAARALRDEGFRQPIVIFSAYLEPGVEAEAADVGATTVSKTDLEQLVGTVASLEPTD